MVASTDQKARAFDLFSKIMEYFCEDKRDAEEVLNVLQIIKDKKNFAEILLAKKEAKSNLFKIALNYCMSMKDMVSAGAYDVVNSDINDKNFQIEKHGHEEVETKLIHFDRNISSENAIKELDKMEPSLRPANLVEMLAFGAKYPDEQRKFPIVALGSVWRSMLGRDVAYLWSDSGFRKLSLRWFGHGWNANYRFLAVRK